MTKHLYILLLVIVVYGCAPNNTYYNWTAPDYSYKQYNKLAVFGLSRDLQDASDFEVSVVNQLRKKGYASIQGMAVLPPEWAKDLDVKTIRKNLLSKGVEGVISLAVVNVSTRTVYTPDASYVVPYGRSRFGSTYITTYQEIYQKGYYSEMSNFIYEAHFYDLTSEDVDNNLVWTFQFKYDNSIPGIPELASFSKTLLDALVRDNIL